MKNDYKYLTTSINGHILEVTINRPEVYNALHPPSQQECHSSYPEAQNPYSRQFKEEQAGPTLHRLFDHR